jgi:hypothetical protein
MPAKHPALKAHANNEWRDVHCANDAVRCVRYEITPQASTPTGRLADVGGALAAVLQHAFDEQLTVRAGGGRWSLSNIGRPKDLLLDIANHRSVGAVADTWLSAAYAKDAQKAGVTPMFIAAGVTVNVVNRELAKKKLALQTSGASDGQTFAGAIATGTHGADMKVGALHDTVLALHVVVSPTSSFLIQPASAPLTQKAADTLARWFGIPCELKSDELLFRAARVHLGSLGVVLNVIVETVPLYYLLRRTSVHRDGDARWRAVLTSRHPNGADEQHPANPDTLALVLHPYLPMPETEPRAFLTSMTKLRYGGQAGVSTEIGPTSLKSDLADLIPGLVHLFEDDVELPGNPILRLITSSQLRSIYGSGFSKKSALPGVMFGPPDFLGIDFDPIRGASAEYVFNATQARAAVTTILDTLAAQVAAGNQYLGGIGVRFVKGSNALLAPNAKQTNCFVELQSLHTDELPALHTAIGKALTKAGIAYCGHWGQLAMNTPAVVKSWWAPENVAAWNAARVTLLPTAKARKIFASPILASAGLEL